MAAGTPLSAKNAKVRIGVGVVLYAAAWDVNPETTWLDSSNFESGGFEQQVDGLSRCEVTIEGWWDAGANIHDAPMIVRNGITLLDVRCYISGTTGPHWYFPLLNIRGVPVTARVAEKVMYRLVGKAYGTFTYPTGNVA